MADPTAITEQASLVETFDRHASLRIDSSTYRTNDILRDFTDRIVAAAGLVITDVSREGLTVYRSHAVINVFENTADGKWILRDDKRATRVVTVPLDIETLETAT